MAATRQRATTRIAATTAVTPSTATTASTSVGLRTSTASTAEQRSLWPAAARSATMDAHRTTVHPHPVMPAIPGARGKMTRGMADIGPFSDAAAGPTLRGAGARPAAYP